MSEAAGSASASSRLAGAFASLRALDSIEARDRGRLFGRLRKAGLGMLITEGAAIPESIERQMIDAGLQLGGGLACFSDHAGSFHPVPDSLRPIIASGALRPQTEWYRGIIPTDRAYEDALVRACREAAAQPSVTLFTLDFIRWPVHWELELREGAAPVETSFDPTTLGRFREEMDVDVPVDDPPAAAERIASQLELQWTAFKCRVVTNVVERIVVALRAVRPGLPVGAFIVPGDDEQRRRHAGQDVAAIGEHVDLLLPMAYHAILERPPDWVQDVVLDIGQRTSAQVIPVVQATAEPAVAGRNDWGAPFPPAELGEAIDAGLRAGGAGFVVFPAHGLDDTRLAEVTRRLRAADRFAGQ